ncbi:hypothetical protein HYS96_03210 [Candidatus Daviesbacteria bacterium]|nr:hypothetical protein [Candidatus Daviesbacteria bacterium]
MSHLETSLEEKLIPRYRPIDMAVRRIPPKEAAGFIRGCGTIYVLTANFNPDVIFIPERGAGPIGWALETLGNFYGRRLYQVSLPLGTHIEVETGIEARLTKVEKKLVAEWGVERALGACGSSQRFMLIDEAQSGATITTAAHRLSSCLQRMEVPEPLYVIAAQDSRNGWSDRKKAHGFKTLIRNNCPYVRAEIVKMPLFSTDRQVFLNHILYSVSDEPLKRPLRQKITCNMAAIRFITNLTLAMVKPQDFGEALKLSVEDEGKVPEQEGGDNAETRIRLSCWIRSLLVSTNGDEYRARAEEILNWFLQYNTYLQD